MATEQKILKLNERLMAVSREIYNLKSRGAEVPKNLGSAEYTDSLFTYLGDWVNYLETSIDKIGPKFFFLSGGIVNTSFEDVKAIVEVEDTEYTRGDFVGPFDMRSLNYFDTSPPSLVLTGEEHTTMRNFIRASTPESTGTDLSRNTRVVLEKVVPRFNALNLNVPTEKVILDVLHRHFLQMELTQAEINDGTAYANNIPFAALPQGPINGIPVAVAKAYAKKMTKRYASAPGFAPALAEGKRLGLSRDQAAQALFMAIHLAAMRANAALAGSLVGMTIQQGLSDVVRAEYDSVVDADGLLDQAKVDALPNIHAILMETARLHPPVRTISPVTTKPQSAVIGDTICPFHAGTRWGLNLYTANRDPARWDDPGTFKLHREGRETDVLTWNGWNDTGRDCTGTLLSMQICKAFALTLFGRYDWADIDASKVFWDAKQFNAAVPKYGALGGDLTLKRMKPRAR